jgi:hypothetical protein
MGHKLSSITQSQQDEFSDATSMFITTTTGEVFEYQIPKYPGMNSPRFSFICVRR